MKIRRTYSGNTFDNSNKKMLIKHYTKQILVQKNYLR